MEHEQRLFACACWSRLALRARAQLILIRWLGPGEGVYQRMLLSAAKLKKLRNRSLHELYVRGRQQTVKLAERLPIFSQREMSDRSWLGEIRPGWRQRSAEETASSILNRIGTSSSRNFFHPSVTGLRSWN